MAKPYSMDLRERFARALGRGLAARAAARLLEVSESTGVKWAQRWRATGSIAARPTGGDNSSRIKGDDASWVVALVAREADLTLEEIRTRLAERGVRVSVSGVWRFLKARDLSFKKNPARERAGPSGRRGRTRRVARTAGFARSGPPGLHRRNLGQDQHDP